MGPRSDRHPIVTVALPFLDEARFLAAAVSCVREQTEASWELLLVDDGSTDSSGDLADDLARADPERISVLRHPGGANRGLRASRNLAMTQARGEFLCSLDADDQWYPDKLATQLELFRAHPEVVMVCGPSVHRPLGADAAARVQSVLTDAPRLVRRAQFARMRARGTLITPSPSDVMCRVDALRQVGGVPAGPTMFEDQRTFVAMSMVGPVYVDSRPLSIYTLRDDSICGRVRNDFVVEARDRLEFERWMARYCARRGVQGLSVVACLFERRLRRGVGRRWGLLRNRIRERRARPNPSVRP